jgi:hypothetical protein
MGKVEQNRKKEGKIPNERTQTDRTGNRKFANVVMNGPLELERREFSFWPAKECSWRKINPHQAADSVTRLEQNLLLSLHSQN